jgi:hypothetical protein
MLRVACVPQRDRSLGGSRDIAADGKTPLDGKKR